MCNYVKNLSACLSACVFVCLCVCVWEEKWLVDGESYTLYTGSVHLCLYFCVFVCVRSDELAAKAIQATLIGRIGANQGPTNPGWAEGSEFGQSRQTWSESHVQRQCKDNAKTMEIQCKDCISSFDCFITQTLVVYRRANWTHWDSVFTLG